jgi:hypothetical protein
MVKYEVDVTNLRLIGVNKKILQMKDLILTKKYVLFFLFHQ